MSTHELRDTVASERVLAEHPPFDAVELTIRDPEGRERTKPMIRHRGSVVIVPLLEQPGRAPRVVLVRNERVVVGERLLECPAGCMEPGESPSETAERELAEETGYRGTSLYPIGSFYTSPGLTDERMHAFVASGLMYVGQDLEADEVMTVEKVSAGELLEWIETGKIEDAKTMLTVMLAQRLGYLEE